MDSVTMAYLLDSISDELILLSFNYGQRHKKELQYARECAFNLKASWKEIGLPITHLLEGSSLTDETVDVPEGHYADETMKLTVVPNRNMIMLSIATAVAVVEKADSVYIAVHAGDHAIYPDCRSEFITQCSYTAALATEGFSHPAFTIEAPFISMTKTDIARLGESLGVPWDQTWSCYKGEMWHCGKCGTCVERKEAFVQSGVADPTVYASE
jgi:7-cyano-7-deazaguanine synthase